MGNPYEILGVHENDKEEVIKHAYYSKAKKLHPDKGGNPEKFKELNDAYEKIIKGTSEPKGGFPGDMFTNMGSNMFFNAMNGGRHGHNIFKQTVEVRVKLEDIYKEKSFQINGNSINIPANYPLYTKFSVNDTINIILKHNTHALFNVENNGNIRINQRISLYEALMGFAIRFKHPDGRCMFVSKKGIIKQDECIVYKKMGIPCLKQNFVSDLEIVFKIDMPHNIANIESYEKTLADMLNFNIPKLISNDNDVIL
jgi:DnaJ-class molecular chaperone